MTRRVAQDEVGADSVEVQPWREQIERVRDALDYGLGIRHKTRIERRYGENNYWEVDVHEPEGCKRCEVEDALDALTTQIEELEQQSAFNANASKEHADRYLHERDKVRAQLAERDKRIEELEGAANNILDAHTAHPALRHTGLWVALAAVLAACTEEQR